MRKLLILVTLFLTACGTCQATSPEADGGEMPLLYRNFKATIVVDSMAGLAPRVESLAGRCGGAVTRFTVDRVNGTASATLTVRASRLEAFSKGMPTLGRVASEEIDSNDYTQSMKQEQQKARMYRALGKAPVEQLVSGTDLAATEKEVLATELRTYFAERARNAEQQMANYGTYQTRTFVQLTFRGANAEAPNPAASLPNLPAAPAVAVAQPGAEWNLPLMVAALAILGALIIWQRKATRR